MTCKHRLLFFILSLFTVGCSLLPNQVKLAEQMMATNPDSALQILQHIHPNQSLTDADKALYGILLFQALDKSNKQLQPDSLITFSVRYYEGTNDKEHLAMSYYYKARLYKKAQRFEDATLLYLKALDLGQNNKNYRLLGDIYSDMGDICSMQMDYNEALNKYNHAIRCYNQAGDSLEASYKTIYLGRVFRLLEQYKRANLCYIKALNRINDSILQGSAYQEIGINFYKAKQYDSAQIYLRKSILFPYKGTDNAIRYFYLADLFFDIQQYDSACRCALTSLKFPSTFFNQRDCYRVLANAEFEKGNFKQMGIYMTKYQECTDSVRKVEMQTKTTVLEDLHATNGAYSKSMHSQIILGVVIIFVVLLAVYIVFQLRKWNKIKENELKQVEIRLTEKQSFLRDNLKQKIDENKFKQNSVARKAPLADRESFIRNDYNLYLNLDKPEDFKKLMNQTFNNIVAYIEGKYPDVNFKEIAWCCLFMLDIPSKDISVILDCLPASIYKLKQRLSQKMNMGSTRELDQFLIDWIQKK